MTEYEDPGEEYWKRFIPERNIWGNPDEITLEDTEWERHMHPEWYAGQPELNKFKDLGLFFNQTEYPAPNQDGSVTAYTSFQQTLTLQESPFYSQHDDEPPDDPRIIGQMQRRADVAGLTEAFSPLIIPQGIDPRTGEIDEMFVQMGYALPYPRWPHMNAYNNPLEITRVEEIAASLKQGQYTRRRPDGSQATIITYENIIKPSDDRYLLGLADFRLVQAATGFREAFSPIFYPLRTTQPHLRFDSAYLRLGYERPADTPPPASPSSRPKFGA
jgi:hypothetical protein